MSIYLCPYLEPLVHKFRDFWTGRVVAQYTVVIYLILSSNQLKKWIRVDSELHVNSIHLFLVLWPNIDVSLSKKDFLQ